MKLYIYLLIYCFFAFILQDSIAQTTDYYSPDITKYAEKLYSTSTYGDNTSHAVATGTSTSDLGLATFDYNYMPLPANILIQSVAVNIHSSSTPVIPPVVYPLSSSCASLSGAQAIYDCVIAPYFTGAAKATVTVRNYTEILSTFSPEYILNHSRINLGVCPNPGTYALNVYPLYLSITYISAPFTNSISWTTPPPASTLSINGALPTGGSAPYTYQWQSSTDQENWTNISGATSQSYSVTNPNITFYYRRLVTSSSQTSASNSLGVLENTICCSEIVECVSGNFTPAAITDPASLSGSTYTWQSSSDLITWSTISGATSSGYTPGNVSGVKYYRRSRVNSGITTISNIIKKQSKTYNNTEYLCGTYSSNTDVKANQSIIAGTSAGCTTEVNSGIRLRVRAGNSISLTPGFWAKSGSTFNGAIGTPCNSSFYWREENSAPEKENFASEKEMIKKWESAFPNPISSGYLNFGRKAESFSLLDHKGSLVRQGTLEEKMEISGLGKGIYMLKVDNHYEKVVIE